MFDLIQRKIRQILMDSPLEDSVRSFLLSPQKGVLFGGGNQARIFLRFCRIFHKHIKLIVVSNPSRLSLPEDEACEPIVRLEDFLCKAPAAFDMMLAVGPQAAAEMLPMLKEHGLQADQSADWETANRILHECERALFAFYDDLSSRNSSTAPVHTTAYIHIGMPKCGSTSLQHFLWLNREELFDVGYCYPEPLSGANSHYELLRGTSGSFDAYELPPHFYPAKYSPAAIYNDLFSQYPEKKFLLSSEMFCRYDAAFFRKNLRADVRKFVTYVRSPLLYAQSGLVESVRMYVVTHVCPLLPSCGLFVSLAEQLKILQHFSAGSEEDMLIVSLHGGDVAKTFCSLVGIPTEGLNFNIPRANSSLGVDYAFFLAHLSFTPVPFEQLQKILIEVYALSRKHPSPKYRLFSRRQISEIPLDLIHQHEELGKRIGDPDFWDRGYREVMAMDQCPYRQLSKDRQYEIFEQLSPESQKAILDVWPRSRELPGKLRGSAFLPDIPEDAETAAAMRLWCQRLRSVR